MVSLAVGVAQAGTKWTILVNRLATTIIVEQPVEHGRSTIKSMETMYQSSEGVVRAGEAQLLWSIASWFGCKSERII